MTGYWPTSSYLDRVSCKDLGIKDNPSSDNQLFYVMRPKSAFKPSGPSDRSLYQFQ